MDIPFKCIGNGEIDPTSRCILLVVSWHMTEGANTERNLGLWTPVYLAHCITQLSAAIKELLPSELSVQRSNSFHDMQTKRFSLLEQSFVIFFEEHDRTHLALG